MGLRDFFKIDNTPPGTKRRAAAKAKREAEQKAAAAKKVKMAEQIKARNAKEKTRQGKAIAKTAVSRPSRPAISMSNAADPKTKRPATPAKPPTSRVKPLSAGKQNITSTVTRPTTNPTVKPAKVGKTSLTRKPQVTGLDGRNVTSDGPSGKRKRANVTREQMEKVGLDPSKKSDLTKYLNKFDKLNRRPRRADFSKVLQKKFPLVTEVKNRMADRKERKQDGPELTARKEKFNRGGMAMKTKMGTKGMAKGGAMKTKGMSAGGRLPMVEKNGKMIPAYAADGKGKMMAGGPVKKMKSKGMAKGGMMKSKGMAKGGAMKTKGYSKGGAMKTKGYSTGGVLKGKKNKVRGAGIARKGVRPAKML